MLSSIIFYKKKGKTEYVGSNEVPKVYFFFFWINKEEYIDMRRHKKYQKSIEPT